MFRPSFSISTALILVSLPLVACGGSGGDDPTVTDDALHGSGRGPAIAGFDFAGLKRTHGLADGQACAEAAGDDIKITDRCNELHGKTMFTSSCKTLCSVPVAPEGKVTGYDLRALKIADALPESNACPEAVDDALTIADLCVGAHGKTTYTKACKVLCSRPIAPAGKVAGYDFDSYRVVDSLAAGEACPESASELVDACLAADGTTTFAKGCSSLCSVPIAH